MYELGALFLRVQSPSVQRDPVPHPLSGVTSQWDCVRSQYTEDGADSRSVMLLNVLGCTRTTMMQPTS